MPTRRPLALALAATVAAAVLTACDVTGPDVEVEGEYALETVNELAVPATILSMTEADGTVLDFLVSDGAMALEEGAYVFQFRTRALEDGELIAEQVFVQTGNYTVAGNTVTFAESLTGATGAGLVAGPRLTLNVATSDFGTLAMVFLR